MSSPRPASAPTSNTAMAVLFSLVLFAPAPGAGMTGPVPCSLECAADLTVSNDPGSCGAGVDYPSPVILGTCGPITCTPPVGPFPGGTTVVTCSESTTASGLTGPLPGASCSFNVTVADTEPPVISCPADQTVAAPAGATTAIVEYPFPEITDNCLEIEAALCVPASGDEFPLGDTITTCSTADGAGNPASCEFVVSVGVGGSILEVPSLTPGGLMILAVVLAIAAILFLHRGGRAGA